MIRTRNFFIGLALTTLGTMAFAQCGVTISCAPPAAVCTAQVCFADEAAKRGYEQENACTFPPGPMCGDAPIDQATQCCSKDVRTGKNKIRVRQISVEERGFDWSVYVAECMGMRQSESPPDALWAQCTVGQRHSPSDHYPVREVIPIASKPKARSYCIDGCSTPPGIVETLTSTGYFIFPDKDNPSGAGPGGFGPGSSFYGACANHDKCYQTCSGLDQRACDDQLLADMRAVCGRIPPAHETTFVNNIGVRDRESTREKCQEAADAMHRGLRLPVEASRAAFKTRRQQYCQCC